MISEDTWPSELPQSRRSKCPQVNVQLKNSRGFDVPVKIVSVLRRIPSLRSSFFGKSLFSAVKGKALVGLRVRTDGKDI